MTQDEQVLTVDDLSVDFRIGRRGRAGSTMRAVDHVSLHVGSSETLGLVGESGSGKSTLARAILHLVRPSTGSVILNGTNFTALKGRELRSQRRHVQMVFQDPYSSLDPSMVVAESVAEPLRVHDGLKGDAKRDAVAELLTMVGLSRDHLLRYPYEFSGGQRQRIAIARAIALRPSLLVCDEAVSALDVSTQNQVINLLEDLQDDLGLSYLFITHDLGVARHLSHRVAVMYLGQLVEVGPTERIFERPGHPYTEALLSAAPVPNPSVQRERRRIVLAGDVPNPAAPPSGCRFHTRCPYVMDVCRSVEPPPVPLAGGGWAACHLRTAPAPSVEQPDVPLAGKYSP